MMKKLPIGLKNYKRMKQNYYVVDKTLMIKDFLGRGNEVTLITRPRRFGKTINMSMMAEFFDITKDSRQLFKDTDIMKTEYASEINQYPTIFISFANAKGDKINIVRQIKGQLQKEYERISFIFDNLTEFESNDYSRIKKDLMEIDNGSINFAVFALAFLMRQMEQYYGKKVMIFIDEYDTPFIEFHVQGFYEEIRSGLANMLHKALKTSDSLQFAMLTGIQRVAKENIFSDLNNLFVCTVKDLEYSQYFGFTEEETKNLLKYYGLSLSEDVRNMYDGYRFGETDIYNPWSLINYASRKKLEPYWVNTSSNTMIKKALEQREKSFERGYEELIETGHLETTVYMETSFFEASITENLWGLLVNAGYLTISDAVSEENSIYIVKIPNQEVQREFRNLTAYYLNISGTDLNVLCNALIKNKKEDFEDKYKKMHIDFPSYHDLKDENSYHTLFLGMSIWLCNEYEIISNKEEGKGRCDLILKAKIPNLPSYVLEFKYLKEITDKEQLAFVAKQAVKQIKEKQYDAGLEGRIIYIGLAHHQKDVVIEWVTKE